MSTPGRSRYGLGLLGTGNGRVVSPEPRFHDELPVICWVPLGIFFVFPFVCRVSFLNI